MSAKKCSEVTGGVMLYIDFYFFMIFSITWKFSHNLEIFNII